MGIAISFSTREKGDDGCLQSRLFGFLRDWCGYQTVYYNPHKYQSYSAKRCKCMVWQLPDNDNIVSIHDATNNCRCAPITIIRCERMCTAICSSSAKYANQGYSLNAKSWCTECVFSCFPNLSNFLNSAGSTIAPTSGSGPQCKGHFVQPYTDTHTLSG